MAEFDTLRSGPIIATAAQIDEGLRAYMNKVYGLMSVAMLITGAAAWAISGLAVTSDAAQGAMQIGADKYLTSFGALLYTSPLKWVVMFLPLVMVFALSGMINRLSPAAAQLGFYVYAVAMGVSISSIFIVFTGASIATTFLVTAIAFLALSLYGYVTKRDLSGMGTFLIMGVVGLIVAQIVNMIFDIQGLSSVIAFVGVLIFAGLTAYDTQKIKADYVMNVTAGGEAYLGRSAVMGALSLYLDFINMFMFLLQFLGNRE